ncbi:MAG: DUF305 domain-containing protein [Balneolaceae bacterium]|nr:DUF305 domain-containing protein [Balneolaceae bacterium]MDR9408331.1 DUF305 domain-containing protein [Balneolaceae bacterium]
MYRFSVFEKEFSFLDIPSCSTFSLIFFIACTLSACSASQQTSGDSNYDVTRPESTDSNQRLEELYWSRIDSSKMEFTQADVDFMVGMISHHAQALIMSDLAPKNNASPAIQRLASRIINAQKDEIQSMQKWLGDRNQPVPAVQIDGLILNIVMEPAEEPASSHQQMSHSHSGHSAMDHSGMPGMLTQEELNDLSEQEWKDFDRAFLEYMIAHHEGAVVMVENLFTVDGAAQDQQIFRLASDIQADQTTEIERMELMLREMNE